LAQIRAEVLNESDTREAGVEVRAGGMRML
jgi:hypothetical protein